MANELPTRLLIGLIFLAALGVRCVNLGFGLPAMYDPDEPLFVIKAYEIFERGTLNPGWFGHPGSTTIYTLALVDILIYLTGAITGRFASLAQFADAAYADPSIIFLPSRLVFALFGTAAVGLTYCVARRLFDVRTALLAAALLAFNALHIAWSQVIRTDIQSSVFMLSSLYFAVLAAREGRLRDFILAGIFAGIATATKWPAGAAIVAGFGAIALRAFRTGPALASLKQLGGLIGAMLVGLFVASPFIFLDWRQVLANVSGEVVGGHLGHAGRGFAGNLGYYLTLISDSMGLVGLALVLLGFAFMLKRPIARATILPLTLLLIGVLCIQGQIWSRWLTPLLPMIAIAAAFAAMAFSRRLVGLLPARLPEAARCAVPAIIAAVLLAPSIWGAYGAAKARANDTRDRASDWVSTHVPPGSTILVEHLAMDLRGKGWRVLFPLGQAGCVDGELLLQGRVEYDKVQSLRGGSPIIDFGNIPPDQIGSCKGDFAILTYYDLYLDEKRQFPTELRSYETVLDGGKTVAMFTPDHVDFGGPTVRVVAIPPH